MTNPIINLRCEGPILCEGTIFIRKENRGNGVVVNVLFERKGLGTALEMFKNIFLRKKNEESIGAKDWARNLADTAGGKPGYSTGYSIKENSLIKNINDASNKSLISYNRTFDLYLKNKDAAPERIKIDAFIEKEGSVPAQMRDEEVKISQLCSGIISAEEELKTMSLEDLNRRLEVFEFLYTPEMIAKDANLKYGHKTLKMFIANNEKNLVSVKSDTKIKEI